MEEDQYRATYHEYNPNRCVFEKAILSRRTNCSHAHRFCLAEREGVACQAAANQPLCRDFLSIMRQKSLFALKLVRPGETLPHAKEMRIQLGSLQGLAILLGKDDPDTSIDDIHALLTETCQKFTSLEQLPFEPLIQRITKFQGRRGKRHK